MIRYQVLDKCFRNTARRYCIEDLCLECKEALRLFGSGNVEKRQLYDDIRFMKSPQGWNAPVVKTFECRIAYYSYEDPDFSINNMPLSEGDVNVLRETMLSIKALKGMPQLEWLEETVTRLEDILYLKSGDCKPVIEFEQNPRLKGIEMLSGLFNAIVSRQPLKVEYRNYKDKEFTWTIHPYYLKRYNSRWFLFGLNECGQITNLAIDRIVSYEIQKDINFIPNDKVDFEKYFRDVIGVTIVGKDAVPQPITLQFDWERWPYVLSKPLHPSQEIVDASRRILQITVIPNKELTSLLLSFGNQVEILSPEGLRKEIYEIFLAGAQKYQECT